MGSPEALDNLRLSGLPKLKSLMDIPLSSPTPCSLYPVKNHCSTLMYPRHEPQTQMAPMFMGLTWDLLSPPLIRNPATRQCRVMPGRKTHLEFKKYWSDGQVNVDQCKGQYAMLSKHKVIQQMVLFKPPIPPICPQKYGGAVAAVLGVD